MRRRYYSWDDVEKHMTELIDARSPFEGKGKDGKTCLLVPLSITCNGQLKAAMLQFPDGERVNGQIIYCDCEDFQETDWTPADLPESEWKQYLPKET